MGERKCFLILFLHPPCLLSFFEGLRGLGEGMPFILSQKRADDARIEGRTTVYVAVSFSFHQRKSTAKTTSPWNREWLTPSDNQLLHWQNRRMSALFTVFLSSINHDQKQLSCHWLSSTSAEHLNDHFLLSAVNRVPFTVSLTVAQRRHTWHYQRC